MATDPRKLRPGELCRLLNSTPLGEVLTEGAFRKHRNRAGMRLGTGNTVDLLAYTAWLVQQRHAPKPASPPRGKNEVNLAELAEGAAGIGSICTEMTDSEPKLTSKQILMIAALLSQPTYAAAAKLIGVNQTTLYRWLRTPDFRQAFRNARRELVESAIGRLQLASGQAVETLLQVARDGRREGDRVRAAIALLEFSLRGLAEADVLHPQPTEAEEADTMHTEEVVQILGQRLRQLENAELSTTEKSRLSGTLALALLRAITVDVLDKRLEALSLVLLERKDKA